ncbi:MAG: GNAT family protein [Deinococcota bacterium]
MMFEFEPIHTERLTVRRFCNNDVDSLYAYRNDLAVMRYQLWEHQDYATIQTFVNEQVVQPIQVGKWIQLALEHTATQTHIGDIAFHLQADGHKGDIYAEVGFSLATTYQGQGYASEGLRAVLSYLFSLPVRRVVAQNDARNVASQRLLTRMGMRPEGYFLADYWSKGEYTSSCHFAILASEWQYQQTHQDARVRAVPVTTHNWLEVATLEPLPTQQPWVDSPALALARCAYGDGLLPLAFTSKDDGVVGLLLWQQNSDDATGLISNLTVGDANYGVEVLMVGLEYLHAVLETDTFIFNYHAQDSLSQDIAKQLGCTELADAPAGIKQLRHNGYVMAQVTLTQDLLKRDVASPTLP